MRLYNAANMQSALETLVGEMLTNPSILDLQVGSKHKRNVYARDIHIDIEDPTPNINLWQVGFQPARWTKFLNEYTTSESVSSFFADVKKMNRTQEKMYICPTKARHNHGNCLIGMTVSIGSRPRVHMFSRSSMLLPVGVLDLSFGACIADQIKWITGRPTELSWTISQLQITSWDMVVWFIYQNTVNPTLHDYFLRNILPDRSEWEKQIWLAHDMVMRKEDPNPSFFTFGRTIKKAHNILDMIREKGQIPTYIPLFPKDYLPEAQRY